MLSEGGGKIRTGMDTDYLAWYLKKIRPSSLKVETEEVTLRIWWVALHDSYHAELSFHGEIGPDDDSVIEEMSPVLSHVVTFIRESSADCLQKLCEHIDVEKASTACYHSSQHPLSPTTT